MSDRLKIEAFRTRFAKAKNEAEKIQAFRQRFQKLKGK